MIDLSQDSNPEHYRFVAKDGQEYVVSDIKFLPDSDKDKQPYKVFFEVDDRTDSYWVAQNGDSRGINRNLSDVGHLIPNTVLSIYDFGSVKANPHDIQIHYEDYGDTVKLTDVINVWNTNTMIEKFGVRWFDEVYRLSTPKVDYFGGTLYIQEGACDYPDTKSTRFEVGETYDKEAFLKYMEVVQQAAQNLSRLRKEFGSKKTITI